MRNNAQDCQFTLICVVISLFIAMIVVLLYTSLIVLPPHNYLHVASQTGRNTSHGTAQSLKSLADHDWLSWIIPHKVVTFLSPIYSNISDLPEIIQNIDIWDICFFIVYRVAERLVDVMLIYFLLLKSIVSSLFGVRFIEA